MALVVVEKQPGNANVCNEADNNRPEPKQQGRVLGIDKVDVGDEAAVGDDRKKGEEATASRAGANASKSAQRRTRPLEPSAAL